MTVASLIQNSFTGGEWAPSLYARTDLAKYFTAVRKLRNVTVHPHGGASNRGGTQFIVEVKNSSKFTRLVPFQFSTVQSYVLEFGDKYIRFIKDGGQVVYPVGDPNEGDVVEVVTTYAEADLPLLKFTQSADVLYITHPNYAPAKLSRTSHYAWTLADIDFQASIAAPTGLGCAGGSGTKYVVTAVNEDGNESIMSNVATGGVSNALTWNAVSGASYYNVYKDTSNSGQYYYIGQATTTSFTEPSGGITQNKDRSPPLSKSPFESAGSYPGVCAFFEQRLLFARTNDEPQTIWGSVVGDFENMNVSYPIQDDDSFKFTINAKQVNEIRWLAPLNEVLLGTSGGEWKMASGSNSDAISPTSVNLKQQSQWGVSHVQPLTIGNTLLFISGAGDTVRDLLYSFEVDGYAGNDLTILANHLFRDYVLTDWAYQQYPDSVVWCVRDDGTLLGLTYKKEHEVMAWHVHDTDGKFESIATIQTADGMSELYCIVTRYIDGSWKRYIERFMPRLPANSDYEIDISDAYFVDCGLSYDNPVEITDAVNGAPTVKLVAPDHGLLDDDFIDVVQVKGMTEVNGKRFKVQVTGDDVYLYTEDGDPIDGTDYGDYIEGGFLRKAVKTISGLDHLEGKTVAALADGNSIQGLVVTGGAITLRNRASRIHVGLPYISDIETMDFVMQAAGASTIQDRVRNIPSVLVRFENTRASFVGPRFDETLVEIPFRTDEPFGAPIRLFTGDKEVSLEASTYREGRVCIRNVDPVPFTILAIIPRIDAGEN